MATQQKQVPNSMYDLDNHEHLMLLSSSMTSDEDDAYSTASSAREKSSLGNNENDARSIGTNTTTSSDDESTSNVLLLMDTGNQRHQRGGSSIRCTQSKPRMKQSLARKLMAFSGAGDSNQYQCADEVCGNNNYSLVPNVESNAVPLNLLSKREELPKFDKIMEASMLKSEKTEVFMKNYNSQKIENHGMDKIKTLDRSVDAATNQYMFARDRTLKLINDMEETMIKVADRRGEKWEFFRDITKKWMKCLKGSTNYINEFTDDDTTNPIVDESQYCQQLTANIITTKKAKNNNRRVSKIKIRHPNKRFHIIAQNIRNSKKTKLRDCLKLPKLTDEEVQQIDEIIKQTNTKDKDLEELANDIVTNHYQFSGTESARLNNLNDALRADTDLDKKKSSTVVTFAPDVKGGQTMTKTPQKMMNRVDRDRINWIDQQLSCFGGGAPLTKVHLEQSAAAVEDYKEFKAKRVINFAFNLDNNEEY